MQYLRALLLNNWLTTCKGNIFRIIKNVLEFLIHAVAYSLVVIKITIFTFP
jgi:hypothetical protein